MPVYEDLDDEREQGAPEDLSNGKRSWQWLSTVNRVCSGVKKVRICFISILEVQLIDANLHLNNSVLDAGLGICRHTVLEKVWVRADEVPR